MPSPNRPLSPHLQVYRPQITSLLSITHRVSGLALSVGSILLVWQLVAASSGPKSFLAMQGFIGSWMGLVLLVAWSAAFYFHLAEWAAASDLGCWLRLRPAHDLPFGRGGADRDRSVDRHHLDRRFDPVARMKIERMDTPLARVRGLGSAREGVHHWWAQRLTAVALVPLSLWWVISIIRHAGAGYAEFIDWVREPLTSILLVVSIGALFWHASLGVQEVLEDYVHHEGVKIASIIAVKFAAVLLAVAGIFAVLRIALGA